MSFKDLEKRLEESGNWAEVEQLLREVQNKDDEYGRTFSYVLSFLNDLDLSEVRDIAVVGGYAILLHLLDSFGEQAVLGWRGSDDFDFGARTSSAEAVLCGNYDDVQRSVSHFHPQKINLDVIDLDISEEPCRIDMYLAYKNKPVPFDAYEMNENFWDSVQTLEVFGIRIPVASKQELLYMKLCVKLPSTGLPREHDILDAFALFALFEKEENARTTWENIPRHGKGVLKKIFSLPEYDSYEKIRDLDLIRDPSENYLATLRTLARRYAE